jgi:hypothetical protein
MAPLSPQLALGNGELARGGGYSPIFSFVSVTA